MRHRIQLALALAAVAALSITGLAQSTGQDEVLLRSAISREVVDGDRPGAMQIYRKLVASSNRTVATEAQTRLAALESGQQPGRVQVRRLFEGVGTRPSRDGRLIPVLRDNGLQLFDVAAGSTRRLVAPLLGRSASINEALVSPNGRQVAYWVHDFERSDTIRLVNVDGSGDRLLFTADNDYPSLLQDWSPDGNHVLVSPIPRESPPGSVPESFLVAVANGTRRSINVGDSLLRFAPDGRFLVEQDSLDLFTVPVAGGTRVPLVEHPSTDRFVGWVPDGRLVFSSDRAGRLGLWALRVQDGRPVGEPELIVSDFGQNVALGVSSSGHVFYGQSRSSAEVYLVRLNTSGGLESGPTAVASRFTGANTVPDYSPDGRFLAYVTGLSTSVVSEIRIRTLATGEERVIAKPLSEVHQLRWYANGRALLLRGGRGGTYGLHRLDIDTGATTVVVERVAGSPTVNQTFSRDGRYLYFIENLLPDANVSPEANALVRLELATSAREEVLRPPTGYLRLYALSPDGTQIAYNLRQDAQDFIYVRPVADGEPRLVHTVSKDDWARAFGGLGWSADGRHVFFHQRVGDADRLTRILASGGAAEPVLNTGIIRRIAVHPDGRQLAIEARSNSRDTFVMEGVFPPAGR